MLWLYRKWKRSRLARKPFPEAWRTLISQNLRFARALEGDERERFETHLKVFAHEKRFEGAQGFEVDDRVRVVISGIAARIARNLPLDAYDRVGEVVVYGSHFKRPGDGAYDPRTGGGRPTILGEVHHFGTVVLSWPAIERGLAVDSDGRDTGMHEFAHALDLADGGFDGTPIIGNRSAFRRWVQVFSRRFEELRARPRSSVLRAYGAKNEAEFFAVATEVFFERPRALKREQPDLYTALSEFYRVDPVQRAD